MPYRKDNIGDTPYYVPAYETRFFRPVMCERIHQSLRGIGINVHKSKCVALNNCRNHNLF